MLATKGDAESRWPSGCIRLAPLFSAIEVMKNKEKVISDSLLEFGIRPSEMTMVGNSVRSDILPVIGIAGGAITFLTKLSGYTKSPNCRIRFIGQS